MPAFDITPAKPGAQTLQSLTEVLPVAEKAVYTPAGHLVQLAEAAEAVHVPAAQAVQVAESAAADEPAAHAVQPPALVVPGLVTEPA